MKPTIVFSIILFLFASLATGCGDMYELQRIHEGEIIYSGRVADTTVRTYAGFERVALAWNNPQDAISKKTYITYKGLSEHELEFETLIDTLVVEGLADGVGYDFTIYTVNANGNLSVPTKVNVLPVSQTLVDALIPPTCRSVAIGDGYGLEWLNLSTLAIFFAGQVTYEILDPVTEAVIREETVLNVKIYQQVGIKQILQEVTQCNTKVALPELAEGASYRVNFQVKAWPVQGKDESGSPIRTMDEVWVAGTTVINL